MSITIALAGNPNCGKTTLFNEITGSRQHVGNWPGVTVEKKDGVYKKNKDVVIMDLPGTYSLSPYSAEEIVARDYIVKEKPDAVINIVDGTNIERNLYLSTQLMELGIPVVMAVNMMDVVAKNGDQIHIKKLSEKLGCPVVEISALKGSGIKEAAEQAVRAAQGKKANKAVHKFSPEVEEVLPLKIKLALMCRRGRNVSLPSNCWKKTIRLLARCSMSQMSRQKSRPLRLSWTTIPRALSQMSAMDILPLSSSNAAPGSTRRKLRFPIKLTVLSPTVSWRCRFLRQ